MLTIYRSYFYKIINNLKYCKTMTNLLLGNSLFHYCGLVSEFTMFVATSSQSLRDIVNSLNFLCSEIETISLKT
jgi:hypothetical protein